MIEVTENVHSLALNWKAEVLQKGGLATKPHRHSLVHILVVDDFDPWRRQVCSILGVRPELRVVAEAADGLEAVQKAEELKPDLVLLDIGLPSVNGLEAAGRICQLAPGTKIIFVTQNSDKDMVQAALSNGAQGYVVKTDAASELLAAVAAVLGGDHFLSSGVKAHYSAED